MLRRRTHLWLLAAAACAVCLLVLAGEVVAVGELGFPLDDSWIHLQFARNLAAGNGLSYEPGRPVTGSTAPLWTVLVSLVFSLPGSPLAWVKALGIVLYAGCALGVYGLARRFGVGHGLALVAAVGFVATDWMVWSALSGMEVMLFCGLSVWGMIFHLRERRRPHSPPLALPLFALSTLARPEGILLLALATLDRLLRLKVKGGRLALSAPGWKSLARGWALALALLVPALLFYRWAGGLWLPTTYSVKTEGVRHLLPSTRDLYQVLGVLFRPQPFLLLLSAAGIVRLLERVGTRRDRGLLPALWLVALPLAYSTLSSGEGSLPLGNFGRYVFPLFPALLVLGVVGLEPLARRWRRLRGRGTALLAATAVLLVVLFWPTLSTLVSGVGRYTHNVADVTQSDVAMGRWIEDNLPPDATLGLQDIGAIKYHVKNPIVDLTGIVNPEILPYLKGPRVGSHPSRLGGLMSFVEERKVDFLVLYPASYPGLGAFVRPEEGFEGVHGIELSNNITMAGSRLVVFRTPWSAFGRGGGLSAPDPERQRAGELSPAGEGQGRSPTRADG